VKSPRLVLGVTGSISAYRAADLASILTKAGVEVDIVVTREGLKFVTALTLQTLSRRPVYTDDTPDGVDGRPTHIGLADDADGVLVAPATANVIAQYALGLAPDLLTSLLLATPAPVWVAPAMNGKMWHHPAVQANVKVLSKRGVEFIGPDAGLLACGYEGIGRLWPVDKISVEILRKLKEKK
jgi:phosphopantothenoylcysteine synthetase/decarboxylase